VPFTQLVRIVSERTRGRWQVVRRSLRAYKFKIGSPQSLSTDLTTRRVWDVVLEEGGEEECGTTRRSNNAED